jgi:predicted negative regulator of RcsB-dependent stress response
VVSDRTEEEQVEALKKWFEDNGVSLVVGIVLALAAVFGYRAWDNNVRETEEAASAIYENLVTAVVAVPLDGLSPELLATGKSLADQLKEEYSDSSYALFAALQMARIAVDADDLEKASAELQWIVDNGAEGSLELISRMRLARVLLEQGLNDEAMAALDTNTDLGAHHSSWEEVKGDIYLAMDKIDEARQAYQLAMSSVSQAGAKPYLNMKLEDLTFAQATDRVTNVGDSLEDKNVDGDNVEEETVTEEPVMEEKR